MGKGKVKGRYGRCGRYGWMNFGDKYTHIGIGINAKRVWNYRAKI